MHVSFAEAHPNEQGHDEVHYLLMMDIWWGHPNDPSMVHLPTIALGPSLDHQLCNGVMAMDNFKLWACRWAHQVGIILNHHFVRHNHVWII